tara:strand:+ start:2014 stop:2289 length:276 start_codon:yes stop_codon:yes gene_type:complete
MARTKLIGDEVALGLNQAGGLTVSNATVVRVHNGAGTTATVSIAKSTNAGYADTSTVSIPNDSVEFFEKSGADLIWASAITVKAAKVGFTG